MQIFGSSSKERLDTNKKWMEKNKFGICRKQNTGG